MPPYSRHKYYCMYFIGRNVNGSMVKRRYYFGGLQGIFGVLIAVDKSFKISMAWRIRISIGTKTKTKYKTTAIFANRDTLGLYLSYDCTVEYSSNVQRKNV